MLRIIACDVILLLRVAVLVWDYCAIPNGGYNVHCVVGHWPLSADGEMYNICQIVKNHCLFGSL
jgi:hypothetical protein